MKQFVKIEDKNVWEGSMEQWEKHKDCIVHWCSGGDVELKDEQSNKFLICKNPAFHVKNTFRVMVRKPKAGEVWSIKNGEVFLVSFIPSYSDPYPVTNLSSGVGAAGLKDLDKFVADSVEQYFAHKFWEEARAYDSGHDYGIHGEDLKKVIWNAGGDLVKG